MYHYILLYTVIYKCVNCIKLKAAFVGTQGMRVPDGGVKLNKVEIPVIKPVKQNLIYKRDGVSIKLPRFSRPRKRFIRILESTGEVDYSPLESLLETVKDRSTFTKFENIKRTFLQIAKWIFFRRREIINHELFPELRSQVLKNASLFGSVYSRFLKSMLKSSRVYGGYGIKGCLKYYIKYRDGNFTDQLSLPNIAEFDMPYPEIPDSFYSRLLNLCKNNDKLEVLESVFKNSRIRTKSLLLDMFLTNNPLIDSNWGYLCHHSIVNSEKSTVSMISEISKPEHIGDFSYIKTGESDLDFANRHFGTVLNLFSQVYKIENLLRLKINEGIKGYKCNEGSVSNDEAKTKNDLFSKLGICVVSKETDELELCAIYYKSKFKLLKLNKLEDYVVTFIEMVDYVNKCVERLSDGNSGDCNYSSLRRFIHCVCRFYMSKIKGHFSHINNKLDLIYDDLFSLSNNNYNLTVTSNTLHRFRKYGLDRFANIFNTELEGSASHTGLYGIMKDDSSTFLYDFINSRIVTSSNVDSMDYKNLKHTCLDNVKYCHLIIFSRSEHVKKLLVKNTNFIKENYKQLMDIKFDPLVTLDLPNVNRNVVNEFNVGLISYGEIIKHPVNSQLYITLNDWTK